MSARTVERLIFTCNGDGCGAELLDPDMWFEQIRRALEALIPPMVEAARQWAQVLAPPAAAELARRSAVERQTVLAAVRAPHTGPALPALDPRRRGRRR
jgi:hypothetical protein